MKHLQDIIKEGLLDIEDNDKKDLIRDIVIQFLKDNYIGISNIKVSKEPNVDGKYVVDSKKNIEVNWKGRNHWNITSLTNDMFVFGNVAGDFLCSHCDSLISLEGSPQKVGGNFDCSWCKNLTSLEGAPKEVGGEFRCVWCKNLTSLEGASEKIGKVLDCRGCDNLKSLKDAPKNVEIKNVF